MARKSDLTGKGPLFGNHRSHALNANRKKWNVNLQQVKIKDPKTGETIKLKLTAKEMRTLRKAAK